MIGINKAPVVSAGLRTDFLTAAADVDPQSLGKLVGQLECIGVIIQNRLSNLDNTANNTELLVGTGAGCVYHMLPGQESPLIYCNNLNDIWVQMKTAAMTPCQFVVICYSIDPEA
jgi:hypothetical protein